MTAAERAYAEARGQGLPAKIEDPSALAQIAELLASRHEGGDVNAAAA